MHHREPDRLRRVEIGLAVCAGHHALIDAALIELPTMAAELTRCHVSSGHGIGRVSASAEEPIPYRDPVGDERAMIRGQLASWSGLVAAERHVAGPTAVGPRDTAPYLRRHLTWLLRHCAALDFAAEILERRARAFSLLYPSGRRRFMVVAPNGKPAQCGEQIDGQQCPGILYAVIRDTDALLPSALTCDECGLDLPAHSWLAYGRRMRKEATAIR